MNRSLIKYVLLIIFVVVNIFGINKSIPTEQLLQMYLLIVIIPVLIIFILKSDLLNLLLLWFIAALFRGIGMIPLPSLPDIFAERIIWVAIVIIFLFSVVFKKIKLVLPITGAEITMIVFSVYSLVSMVFSAYIADESIKLNFLLNGYVIPFSLYFLTKYIVDDERKAKKYFMFFVVLGLYLGLTGIFEVLKINQLVFPGYIMNPYIGDHYGRARGPYLMATVNGMVIGSIILMLNHLLIKETIKWRKIFFFIALVIMFVTIVLTFTRGVWIGFALAMLTVSFFISRMRKLLFMILIVSAVLVSYLFYSFQTMYTLKSREQILKEGEMKDQTVSELFIKRTFNTDTIGGRWELILINLNLFADSPIWGHGYGAYEYAKRKYLEKSYEERISSYALDINKTLSHNTTVGILVDLGIIGFALLIYILFSFWQASLKLYVRSGQMDFMGKNMGILFWGIMLIFVTNVQTVEIRFFLFVNSMFFSIAGIVVGQYQRISQQDKELAKGD